MNLILSLILIGGHACAEREVAVERLGTQYGEQLLWVGMVDSKYLLELWVNELKSTWTVLRTDPHGRSCIMSSGTAFRTDAMKHEL